MVVLIIGPSGVGKSDYGLHAANEVSECCFLDLDELVGKESGLPAGKLLPQIGNDAFFEVCRRQVDTLLKSWTQGIAIVAVGAGTLQSDKAYDWLLQYLDPTIAVVAPPEEVYLRGGTRNQNRNIDEFKRTEYSQYRRRLYEIAKYQCDVGGLPLEDARGRFKTMIRKLSQKHQ